MPITEVRTCEHCKKEVIGLCFCNYVPGTPINYSYPPQKETLLAIYHALWLEIHEVQNPTPKWFANWSAKIPSNDCGCMQWLRAYIKTNSPDYANFGPWAIELHQAVSRKVKQAEWDFETQGWRPIRAAETIPAK